MEYVKKILSIPIIILILLFTVSVSYAGEVRAFKENNTPSDGNPYPTLKAALEIATTAAGYNNGYITVLAGESYAEADTPVVLAHNLTIHSTGAGANPKVTINNAAKYALQTSDKLDLIVQNVDFSNAGGISISIEANTATASATFSGCSIYSSGASGITTVGTNPIILSIDNCYFNANNSSGTGSQAGLTWNGTGADSLLTVANSLFNDNKNADVLINGGAPVVTISDTHFSNTQAGVTGISRGAATGSLTVKRCLFRYADANAAAIREEAATSASRMTIFGNIFWSGYGIRFNTAQGNAGIYHNVFYKNAYAIRSASADTPCIAKNNIFYASTVYDYDFNTSNPAALTQDHNCHYNTDAGKYASDAALRAALVNTSVSHNVLADPLLKGSAADLYKYGMWVSDGSPCINAGTDLSSADPAFKILLLRNARWKETETGAAYICTGSTDNTGEYGTGTPVGAFLNQKKFYLSSTGYDTAAGDYDGVKTHRCLKTIAYISQAAPDATHLGTEPGDTYYSKDDNTIKTLTTSSTTVQPPTTTTIQPASSTTTSQQSTTTTSEPLSTTTSVPDTTSTTTIPEVLTISPQPLIMSLYRGKTKETTLTLSNQTSSTLDFEIAYPALVTLTTDPAGDVNPGVSTRPIVDITRVDAGFNWSMQWMRLQITFAGPVVPELLGYIYLDTDQNPATGKPRLTQEYGAGVLGYEFRLNCMLAGAQGLVIVEDASGKKRPLNLSGFYRQGNTVFTVDVPLSAIDKHDGNINLGMQLGNKAYTMDVAPDTAPAVLAGQGAFIPWLNIEQTAGSIAAHGIRPLTLTFDSSRVPEGTYTDHLTISGTAGSLVTEVTVPITLTVFKDATRVITGSVYGAVRGGVTVKLYAVSSCGVEVLKQTIATDGDGNYGFYNLPDGIYTVYAEKQSYTLTPEYYYLTIPRDNQDALDFQAQ